MSNDNSNAIDQARAQVSSIRELVATLKRTRDAYNAAGLDDDSSAYEEAREAILQDSLDLQVRSCWHTPGNGEQPMLAGGEFMLLLATGGPACRIVGDLDDNVEPENPRIEYQDWGTPWTDYSLSEEEAADVLAYCAEYYFGQ